MSISYSSTPLSKKLGIKRGYKILLHNQPENYFDLFSDLPLNLTFLKKAKSEEADFIHIFCTSFKKLKKLLSNYKAALKKDGLIWISWPKGSSEIPTDLKRDKIREYLLSIGLVDVKVASIDEIWSALKFVYRLEDR
jgi:hypothetical protein